MSEFCCLFNKSFHCWFLGNTEAMNNGENKIIHREQHTACMVGYLCTTNKPVEESTKQLY